MSDIRWSSSLPSLLHASLYPRSSPMSEWTWSKNKQFEGILAGFDDFEGHAETIAAKIPGMFLDQIDQRHKGHAHVPHYWNNERLRVAKMIRKRHVYKEPHRRKGMPWSEGEHRLFLMGLNTHGKGNWKTIAKNYVLTRTPTQVASHAQKYFIRHNKPLGSGTKGRSSILDIHTFKPQRKNNNKKVETSTRSTKSYKKIAPSPYPPPPTITTSRLNYSPCESSMVYGMYASPVEAMGRTFTPMPSFLGQAYGNPTDNISNSWYYPLGGSNYGSNSVYHGLEPSGDNNASHSPHNILPNSAVSDTYISMPTNPPTFWPSGDSDGPKKLSDGRNYVSSDPIFPSNGSNIMLNVPPVLPDLVSDPHPMPNNVSNDAICASGCLNDMFDGSTSINRSQILDHSVSHVANMVTDPITSIDLNTVINGSEYLPDAPDLVLTTDQIISSGLDIVFNGSENIPDILNPLFATDPIISNDQNEYVLATINIETNSPIHSWCDFFGLPNDFNGFEQWRSYLNLEDFDFYKTCDSEWP
ncbi:hypothetical protein GIB67_035332 [Kingdonia uniflora]|uniref:Uncharacterized protein n=1 Tax=Kingdonia uniflora TaxID=39325 RepID=A0A7J7LY77_9MAGN|nr:hypothetical protein GIB67_035332 [Kingdonia uniflora]